MDHKRAPHLQRLPSFTSDLASAALSSLAISPIVCLIDNSIASRVATGRPIFAYAGQILRCPRMLLRNLLISPAGRWVYLVYFSTYASANITDSVLAQHGTSATEDRPARLIKFAVISSVSTAATVWKDVRLAHYFGRAGKRQRSVPPNSIGLFVARDCVTILSSFILPPLVARQRASSVEQEASRLRVAQLALPVATQFITTPIHLAGYYLHHDREKRGLQTRWASIKGDLSTAVPIRMLRILPAMGVGNLLNTFMRDSMIASRLDS